MPNRIPAIAMGLDQDFDFGALSEPNAFISDGYCSFSDSISQDLIVLENRFSDFATPNSGANCKCR